MKVWSRGLGRVELAIDLKKTKIVYSNKKLYLVGRTAPPAAWDFVMSVDSTELWRLVRTLMNKEGMKFIWQYPKIRIAKPKEFKERYQETIKTRTGVKPDQDYAELLVLAKKEEVKRAPPASSSPTTP